MSGASEPSSGLAADLAEPQRQAAAAAGPTDDFAHFERFVGFFCRLFKQPGFLDRVECKASHKGYVPQYYAKIFTEPTGIGPRHLKWWHRLRPLLRTLPRSAVVLDYGGGYGMDSILLAACGYRVVFYEISPHHIAICAHFRDVWEAEMGPVDLRLMLSEPDGSDAILLNEVAHHIEPPQPLFDRCARTLQPGGRLFLLEPNYFNPATQAFFFRVRGFKTVVHVTDERTGMTRPHGNENIRPRRSWNKLAKRAGLEPGGAFPIIPYFMRPGASPHEPWRMRLEATPLVSALLASHLTLEYVKRPA